MSVAVSTHGLRLKRGSHALRAAVELLSSMRFAIALLTVICIASIIGTVLKQHEPFGNYVNQFGPFWAQVFRAALLDSVYSAWWFLLILLFLVISTSLCVARNTPRILADFKLYKEGIRAQSLKAFGQHAEAVLGETPDTAANRIGQLLSGGGWKVKLQRRDLPGSEGGWMVAARAGGAHKLGYIAAHSAIVLVCLGGLLDGDLIVKAQTWLNGKSVYTGGGMIADVPAQHRLSPDNPTSAATSSCPKGAGERRDPEPVDRRAPAGTAVLDRAEEVHRRLLLDRHAQALRQRGGAARPRDGRVEARAHRGEPSGQLERASRSTSPASTTAARPSSSSRCR